ncbi:MAG: DUF3175 domain-containing protein [Cyanobacteria bacterium J083]|nr:MAG: DUF3175 domain-containing protein [Cyanobacteria bacterium J083]
MSKKKIKSWSQQVTKTSNALDLEQGVFTWDDPKKIALSLKLSAETSRRRKSLPFRSAMSMLNFYINRAGKKLPPKQREILEKAKEELRELYGRPRQPTRR